MARPRKYHVNPNREAAEAYRLLRRYKSLRSSFVGSSLVDYLLSRGCDISKHSIVPTIRISDFQKSLPDMAFEDMRNALESSNYIRLDFRRGTIKLLTTAAATEKHND